MPSAREPRPPPRCFNPPSAIPSSGVSLLTAVVLAAYNPITHNSFVNYDDEGYILNNSHVRAGLTWETVKWAFTTYDQSNWHPLTWLSHALDCELFGVHPVGHHYISLLLHAANAVLLFLLLQSATGFRWRSLMVAALFALHPINVESVAWASERKNVLSMMFFLLALYAYGWYARSPGVRRYAGGHTGLCVRADVEAAGRDISVPAFAVGLLAAAAHAAPSPIPMKRRNLSPRRKLLPDGCYWKNYRGSRSLPPVRS